MKVKLDTVGWFGFVVYLMDDSLIWVWPWRRRQVNRGKVWFSGLMHSRFDTLEQFCRERETSMYLIGYQAGREDVIKAAVNN